MTDSRDTNRWVWRGGSLAALVVGWLFIAWQNHFHISAPLVVVCLGYLAVVATVSNLWRTGASAVSGDDQDNDSTWAKPAGALGELEREKRTLLKAIKEAEFDHQMGKLSQHDVDDMIRTYRARAIEVIKEIDRLETGATGTPREQIMREVRARLELEARSKKPDARGATKAETTASASDEPQAVADAPALATDAKAEAATDAKAEATTDAVEAKPDAAAEAKDAMSEAKPDAAPEAKVAAADAKPAKADARAKKKKAAAKADAKAAANLEDEGLDADSTTAVEPKRNDPAKEATP